MRVHCLSLALALSIGVGTGSASADEPGSSPDVSAVSSRRSLAISTNLPLMWKDAASIAGSVYVGVSRRHAIRANVASYKNSVSGAAGDAIVGLLGGEGEASFTGRTTDVGLSWIFYPDRVWSGWTLELGALRRARDIAVNDDNRTPQRVATDTTTYAVRAMVGWTWLIQQRVFIAAGAGLSVGRETGTETTSSDFDRMTTRTSVARRDVTAEGYLRFGVAFDIGH
ncbi:MAG TPA: hypothetical protein VLM79_16825 [Kofleriaceae bacterium]|nr:hypothetical protein [Kofleriaceae bacterium]